MTNNPSHLVRRVNQAGNRLREVLDQSDSESELSWARFGVLETIARSGSQGCSQTALAEELGSAESSVSALVERMRRDGLLLRMRSHQDRRCSVLLLTELGEKRLASAVQSRDRQLSHWINRLSSTEQLQLSDLLDRLLLVLADEPLSQTRVGAEPPGLGRGKAA
jgi:DNA-binding MarR family transcriptional regulator